MAMEWSAKANELQAFKITPDGKHAVIFNKKHIPFGKFKNTIQIIDLQTNEILDIPRHPDVRDIYDLTPLIDISPNSRYILVTYFTPPADGHDGMTFYIWDIEKENFLPAFDIGKIKYKSYSAFGVDGQRGYDWIATQFLPDNDRLLTVSASGEVFVWSISQANLLWFVGASAHFVHSVALSKTLGLIAVCENTTTQVRSGRIGQNFTRGSKILYKHFGWDENKAVITEEDLDLGRYFRIWNVYNGALMREFENSYPVSKLVFSQNDKLLAGFSNDKTYIWDVETGKLQKTFIENHKPIDFTSKDYIILQQDENRIEVRNIELEDCHDIHIFDGKIVSAQLTSNNTLFVLCRTSSEWKLQHIQLTI